MIGFFPVIYEDELLYSQLCRYYQRTGYTKYVFAADDLFMRLTARPVIEWVNEYTPDAMAHITKSKPFRDVVMEHTMFPAYARFLPKERRAAALNSLLICDGNYHNLVVNQKSETRRFLQYCPVCASKDRERYGETYWHREHQLIRVDVCPEHGCYLKESSIPLASKSTPGLFSAESEIPISDSVDKCDNEKLLTFTNYVLEVFRQPVNMEADIPVGSFLHNNLDRKYFNASGMLVRITELYDDYSTFIRDICEPMSFDLFRKTYNNYALDNHKICQLAFFEGIPAGELAEMSGTLSDTAMDDLYRSLACEHGISYAVVSSIGEEVITRYRSLGKLSRKSGPKQREWTRLDQEYLPKVKDIVARIYNADGKPGRVSVARVERELGVPGKQFQKLPRCTKYIMDHMETQNEYRARQVTWAVKMLFSEEKYISKNKVIHLLSFRKNDIEACFPFVADPQVRKIMGEWLRAEEEELSLVQNQF